MRNLRQHKERQTVDASSERLEQMLAKLRSRKYRTTPQRMAVLRILAQSNGHPSVEEIYERVKTDFPKAGLATVYKTIAVLKQMGEILELGFADSGSRYDGKKPYPHPHVICTRCGAIVDSQIGSEASLTGQMEKQTGYTITNHRLDFFGLCPKCQKES